MSCHMVEWVNLMLNLGVFQSYTSIVSPFEPTDSGRGGKKMTEKMKEGLSYFNLKKKQMKWFMRV